MFWFPMDFEIYFGIFRTPKLSNYVTFSAFVYNAIQWVPIDPYSSKLYMIYVPSVILDKLFLK